MLPTVPIRFGGHELPIHVDTGSPASVMLAARYLKELPLASEPVEIGKARTVAGEFPVMAAPIKGDIELGEHRLDVPRVRFSDLRLGHGFNPTGNIGYELLKGFVITIDAELC